jgi:hypothetical protein
LAPEDGEPVRRYLLPDKQTAAHNKIHQHCKNRRRRKLTEWKDSGSLSHLRHENRRRQHKYAIKLFETDFDGADAS